MQFLILVNFQYNIALCNKVYKGTKFDIYTVCSYKCALKYFFVIYKVRLLGKILFSKETFITVFHLHLNCCAVGTVHTACIFIFLQVTLKVTPCYQYKPCCTNHFHKNIISAPRKSELLPLTKYICSKHS